ncbi:AAA family ATPase [Streptomyces sp. NPDC001941]|uniref:AAA family ATPase n=1 Tax=Streptomyces sp. NPDC001941 TaxID=3154659 RepID=UPI00332D26FD
MRPSPNRTAAHATGAPAATGAPVGRAELVGRVEHVLHARGRALLTGPAGIGKTEVARAVADRAAARGETVLHLAPQPADRDLPGVAAAALVASLPPGALDALPAPQRAAVAVLSREAAAPGAADPVALRLGLARALRALADTAPTLLVVDDARRLDDDSAELLRFALQLAPPTLRALAVGAPEPVPSGPVPLEATTSEAAMSEAAMSEATASETTASVPVAPAATAPEPAAAGFPLWVPSEADVLLVPPLHADEIADLLVRHRLPARLAGRIHRTSGGNPRLALAVGRSLADTAAPVHHAEALPLSGRARDLARHMLAPATPAVRASLLLAALAPRPTAALIRRAGRPDAEAELAAAERSGLISVTEDGTVAFTAGLLPTTLVHDTPWARRAAGHAALARVADDPVAAVRHRALAADAPDEDLAAEVDGAARTARRRGDYTLAAELALLAAESTPVTEQARRQERLVEAAEEAARAARADLAQRAAADLLARDAAPADRVRARLAVLDTAGQGLTDLDEHYVHAMEDSDGHPALRAGVLLRLAVKYVLADGDPVRSRAAAVESAALADSVGDRRTTIGALTLQARVDRALGSPGAERALERALALEEAEGPPGARNTARILTIRHALLDDRLSDARARIHALLPLVERRGSAEDVIELHRTLAEVEARRGHCATARAHAARSLALTLEAGLSPGPAWYALALAETAGGTFARAADYARRSVQASEEEGDRIFLSRARYALGRVQLVTGDVAGALDTLRRVQEGENAQSAVDPSMLRWHEELAEALLASDAREEAEAVLADVGPVADRLGRTTVLLSHDRVYALCLAAGGKADEAAVLLADTADGFADHGLVLERGRCLIALSRVERRRRRRSSAERALRQAAALFERAGAAPWLALTRGLSAARPEPATATGGQPVLTEGELRLARLVGEGASNQEAAARLYLSVKTVEARLTRIYQKLDVRSRAQLATVLNSTTAPGP